MVFVDRRYASPNHDGRDDTLIDMVVIHYTDMIDHATAIERLCDPIFKVSAHYVICNDGYIYGLVDETRRAWHAGVASWQGATNINHRSIGIELDYTGHSASPKGILPDFPDVQITALIALLKDINTRHDIHPRRVLGHQDIAPDRKIDPGPKFPWSQLVDQNLAALQIAHKN